MVHQNMWFYQKLVFWYKFTEKIDPVFLKYLLEFLFIMSYLNTSDHFFLAGLNWNRKNMS